MKKTNTSWLFYLPIYQAIYPFLFVYFHNLDQVLFAHILPSLSLGLLIIFLIFIIIQKLKDNKKLLCILSFGIFLFFNYGHFYNLIRGIKVGNFIIGMNSVLLLIFLIIYILFFYLIHKNKIKSINYFSFISIIYFIQTLFLLITLCSYFFVNKQSRVSPNYQIINKQEIKTINSPDIYYIILDEYGRNDVLKKYLNFNNDEFENKLKEKGFIIASNNFSNYIETFLSLASSLNFEYINFLSERVGINNKDRRIPYEMIRNNQVIKFLKQYGYLYVDFSNGWGPLDGNKYADIDIVTAKRNEFSRILISTTILEPFIGLMIKNDSRETIISAFNKLQEIPKIKEPTFTFVHFLLPHSPYLFDQDGNSTNNEILEFNKELYLGQLKFANKKILETIDILLKSSTEPPIIILISDHGPDSLGIFKTAYDSLTNDQLNERFGNFMSFYFPEEKNQSAINDLISPVNIFRVIFNRYFNTNLDLLENKRYYSNYDNPYKFMEIN